jgi:molybdopterin/thiamine biosynthesis adenylyltransferase
MTSLSETEREHYHRQLIIPEIGEAGQEKLKKAHVLVIGAGGLGSPVLMYLASAGVGTLGVIDPDKVEASNLQRQILYTSMDVGLFKSEVAARRLSQLNPLINVLTYPVRFTAANADDLLTGYDIAVDCSDNYATRYLLSDITHQAGIPMIYGAVSQFLGQASVFNYMGGPSYRDLYQEETDTSSNTSNPEQGVIGALPGIIGSIQACEVIKIITGAGDTLSGKLLQVDALNLRLDIISI